MSDTDALTTAMTDLVAAERAFADARQRLDATDREIGTREAEVRNAQQVFAEQLEAGETGTKAQLAWAKARTALAALQERREPLAAEAPAATAHGGERAGPCPLAAGRGRDRQRAGADRAGDGEPHGARRDPAS